MNVTQKKTMLAAANRMLRRSRQRRDFAQMSSVADEIFTKIVSVNHRDNILVAIKMAENMGLEATLYADTKIAITGNRDKVLKFTDTLRQKLFGEDLPPTEGVFLVKNLTAMSHDLPPGRLKLRVQTAMSELSSLHPVSPQRMRQHQALAMSVAEQTGYAFGQKTDSKELPSEADAQERHDAHYKVLQQARGAGHTDDKSYDYDDYGGMTVSNMKQKGGPDYHIVTKKNHKTGKHETTIHDGHWDESKHSRDQGGKFN